MPNSIATSQRSCDWETSTQARLGLCWRLVTAMWLVLQQREPDDYVIVISESPSVREFAALAFDHVGLNWEDYVTVDERLCGPQKCRI